MYFNSACNFYIIFVGITLASDVKTLLTQEYTVLTYKNRLICFGGEYNGYITRWGVATCHSFIIFVLFSLSTESVEPSAKIELASCCCGLYG